MKFKDLLVKIDPIARAIGLYTAYELDKEELVGGAVEVDNIREYLLDQGYEEIWLEAAKIHPYHGRTHDISMRKVDGQNPRWQWHVHVWRTGTFEETWSHYEHRPDLERVGDEGYLSMVKRLYTHYWPNKGEDYIKGEASDSVEEVTRQVSR